MPSGNRSFLFSFFFWYWARFSLLLAGVNVAGCFAINKFTRSEFKLALLFLLRRNLPKTMVGSRSFCRCLSLTSRGRTVLFSLSGTCRFLALDAFLGVFCSFVSPLSLSIISSYTPLRSLTRSKVSQDSYLRADDQRSSLKLHTYAYTSSTSRVDIMDTERE
jgi:hypothetical protein